MNMSQRRTIKCQSIKSKGGYRFGKSGKTYRSKDAKRKQRNRLERYMTTDIRSEERND